MRHHAHTVQPAHPLTAFASIILAKGTLAITPTLTAKPAEQAWESLFDGKALTNWQTSKFSGAGAIKVENGQILIEGGRSLTGINWGGPALPSTNYELALQAMRVDGNDFFAGVTFPVGDSFCSLILGGWGGSVVGLSSINDVDASENETSQAVTFDPKRWLQHPYPGHPGEDRSLARRPRARQCRAQGQTDRHPD